MAARTLTLLGPDVLLVAMGGDRPNNAVLVVECGGRLDAARLRRALAALAVLAPFMASRLERPRPWGRLRWRAVDEMPPVTQRRLGAGESIDAVVDAVLNETVDPRRTAPLRWHVVERDDGAAAWVLLAWVHPLMDPRGAELLVAMLDAVDRGGDAAAWAAARLVEPPADRRGWRARGALARRARDHFRTLARARPGSLGADVPRPGRVRHRRRVVAAGARPAPVTLAVVGRAVARLWRERGFPAGEPFLVPLSVDRRLKGEPGPVFGNFLSFHFARFTPAEAGNPAATAATIRRGMAEALRDDLVEALWAGMNFLRLYPPRHLLRPFGGDAAASFHCADTGELRPALPALLGAPVRAAWHVPCVAPRPGLGVFFTRVAGIESVVAVWVEGVLSEAEVERLLDDVEQGIGAAATAAAG